MGRSLNVGNLQDYKVVGVITDPPEATNFPFTVLLDYDSQGNNESILWGGKTMELNQLKHAYLYARWRRL